jgi:cytochrome P450
VEKVVGQISPGMTPVTPLSLSLSLLFRRPWTRQFVHEQPSRSSTPVPVPRTAAAAFEEYARSSTPVPVPRTAAAAFEEYVERGRSK